ncbi:MAG: hypothetical protein AB1Z98_00245 [Nannocystaceae bacterium]
MAKSKAHREWSEHVRRWKASGLSRSAYASEAGLNSQTLGWYAWKLKSAKSAGKPARSRDRAESLAPVSDLPLVEVLPATSASAIELEVDDVTIRVPADFEAGSLRRLLDVLEARR